MNSIYLDVMHECVVRFFDQPTKKTVKRFKKNPQRLLLLLSSHVTKSQRWCQRLIFEILMPYGLAILECIPLFKNLII